MSESALSGRLVGETWLLRRRVGRGTSSELYTARNVLYGASGQVAVKLQSEGTDGVVVRHEADVLRNLSGLSTVPGYYHHGQYKNREYLVMELLGGEDMSILRDRVRKTSGTHLVPLPAAAYLARQMLSGIKDIHSRGFIHRDVKPANFVRRESNSSQFCMIDFGVAKQFRDKNGSLKPKRDFAEFRGTVQYASPFVHEGHDQCPRDDLFSLLLVFMDLVCGKLPWAEAYRQTKDKAAAAASKNEHLTKNPEKMMDWVSAAVVAAERAAAGDEPRSGPVEEGEYEHEPQNFPPGARALTLSLVQYLQSLDYESTPNYAQIDSAFAQMRPAGHPEVGDPSYSYGGFSWTGGKQNFAPDTLSANSNSNSNSNSNNNNNSSSGSSSISSSSNSGGKDRYSLGGTGPGAMGEGFTRLGLTASADPRLLLAVLWARAQQLSRWTTKKRRLSEVPSSSSSSSSSLSSSSSSASTSGSKTRHSMGGDPSALAQSLSGSGPHGHTGTLVDPSLLELAACWDCLGADFITAELEDKDEGSGSAGRDLCELLLRVFEDTGRLFDVELINSKAGEVAAGAGLLAQGQVVDDQSQSTLQQQQQQQQQQHGMMYSDWVELQRRANLVCEACVRVLRRPKPIETFGFKKRTLDA